MLLTHLFSLESAVRLLRAGGLQEPLAQSAQPGCPARRGSLPPQRRAGAARNLVRPRGRRRGSPAAGRSAPHRTAPRRAPCSPPRQSRAGRRRGAASASQPARQPYLSYHFLFLHKPKWGSPAAKGRGKKNKEGKKKN